jgi:hypothetical protein
VYDSLFNDKENHFYENYQNIDVEYDYRHKNKDISKEVKLKHNKHMLIETDMIDESNHEIEDRMLAFRKNHMRFQP